jgi:glycosyltransferase involved in cell wall biosynthesis
VTPVIRLLYTVYPHMGEHTAVKPFVRHLRQALDRNLSVTAVRDSDDDFPIRNTRIRNILRPRLNRRMPWYKLSDATAEVRVGARCLSRTSCVIHYFDGEHTAQYVPLALSKLRSAHVRTVATFHQPPDLLRQLVDPGVLSCVDRIVIVSPIQRPFFEDYLPPDRIRVILAGVDADFFQPRQSPRPSGPLRCVTVGHWLRDWKALRALAVRLRERRAEIELHVVTDRETGLEECSRVHRHRDLSDDDLLALYQSSDVLLLPLTGATANNALLEGLACGLPIVATRHPSVEAYVPAAAALLVEGNDPDLLLEALTTLADERRRRPMGDAARRRADELSWTHVARSYAALYSECFA